MAREGQQNLELGEDQLHALAEQCAPGDIWPIRERWREAGQNASVFDDETDTDYIELIADAAAKKALRGAAPILQHEERDRIHAALKEQAEEYRREAGEAHRRGDQGGWEKLTAAQSVVACVTRIIFDDAASTPQPADHQEGEHRG